MGDPLPKDLDIPRMTMRDLVGIANAIEQEAVRRYTQLAEVMERRGEAATARALRQMLEEELKHVGTVEQWAHDLHEAIPPAENFEWRLPPELFTSWDEVAGSSLLSPYRVLAIAVRNEERAFSMYSYIAAHAEDAAVASEAEKLAVEELQHASQLRRWRRAAYHQDEPRTRAPAIDSLEALRVFLSGREAAIAGCHRAIAARLRRLGDDESANLLERLLEIPSRPPTHFVICEEDDCRAEDSLRLLIAAQRPLETLGEELEEVLAATAGPLFEEAERALCSVVARVARITLQLERPT